VLHSLPQGSGSITKRRVALAGDALNCSSHEIANLYPAPLADVAALSELADADVWRQGRKEIERAICSDATTDILLGYGVQQPSGQQRYFYQDQLAWLDSQLKGVSCRVWTFGDKPSHPSRWQRLAYRHMPGASVTDLASVLLRRQN
jgi:hypothetical protein